MIEAAGLTKRFGGRTAVDGVTFSVPAGSVVGFLGPNGAGKTTTMRLALGVLRPDAGSASRPDAVGYLPELFVGYPQLSVRGYLRYLGRLKGVGDAGAEIDRVLELLELGDLARRPVGRLSRGQRQRVGIAQALLGSPPAYVFDEPTAGLDPQQVVQLRSIVRDVAAAGAAVLVSTHVLAEVASLCDRVVVVVRGRVVADEVVAGNVADLERRFLSLVEGAGSAEGAEP